VLGAVLLGVIVLFVSCSNEDDKNPDAKNASSEYPTPAPASDEKSASPEPSFLESAPPVGPALPDPADLQTQRPDDEDPLPTATSGSNGNVSVPLDGSCADTEIAVTPIPADTTIRRGTPVDIRLKVKNIGTRTCTRDVGSDAQELYLEQGAQKFWSSDPCSTSRGNDIKSFAPGAEREYRITWNGRQSTQCANGQPSGPAPAAGVYELRGRLSQVISKPVTVSVVA
jgi:hypothetical protein